MSDERTEEILPPTSLARVRQDKTGEAARASARQAYMRYLLRGAVARSPDAAMRMDVACGVRSANPQERAEQRLQAHEVAHILHLVGEGSPIVREEFREFVDEQMFPKPQTKRVKKKEAVPGIALLEGPLPDGIPSRFVAIDLEKR